MTIDSPDSEVRPRAKRMVMCTVVVLSLVGALLVYMMAWRPARRRPTDWARVTELGRPGRASGFNLLLITLDTVRADHLGCYGAGHDATPTIDRLAGHGVRFMQAIAPAPLTLPSHATVMTGLGVPAHGVRNNGTFRLADEHETLAEVLKESGYATGAFIGAYVLDARYGLNQGFDHYDGDVDGDGLPPRQGHYVQRRADRVTDAAVSWLSDKLATPEKSPFFAWVHYFDAHAPYDPPASYQVRYPLRLYDGEIAFIDDQISRLARLLEERNVFERTLIVIAADHGEGLGEHNEAKHSNLIYDSTMRVPLILTYPGLSGSGISIEDRVVGLIDVFPLVLDLLGVDRRPPVDGINPLTTLPDETRAIYIETLLPLLHHGWAPLHGLRRLNDKYIKATTPEYYDVLNDPRETKNRLTRSKAAAEELERRLEALTSGWASHENVIGHAQPLDNEQWQRLGALGYVRSARVEGPIGVLDPKVMITTLRRSDEAADLMALGHLEKAAELVEEVLNEYPHDARVWELASWIYEQRGDLCRAAECIQRMLQLDPIAHGYVRLAELLQVCGQPGEYDRLLKTAEALDPSEGAIYVSRGNFHAAAGRLDEAMANYAKALELDPVKSGSEARARIARLRMRTGETAGS